MISFTDVLELSKTYRTIPLAKEVAKKKLSELNLSILKKSYSYLLLLESGEHGEEHGRFTYLSPSPFLIIQSKDQQIRLSGEEEVMRQLKEAGIDRLKDQPKKMIEMILKTYRSPKIPTLPYFTGGAIGYFSYEWVKRSERIETKHQRSSPFSEFHLAFIKELLVFDHEQERLLFIDNLIIDPNETKEKKEEKYRHTMKSLEEKAEYWRQFIAENSSPPIEISKEKEEIKPFQSSFTKEQFVEGVKRLKEAIRQGEIFQAVLSLKQSIKTDADAVLVYQILRKINPSPYMVYLQMADETIIGASPETLVKIVGDEIATYPIAGTRPRGKTPLEEKQLAEELQNDPKEIAEHVMLIDLARNDLGKVSQPGSVKVAKKMKIEKYSHVMHLVSKVIGKLKAETTSLDVLEATFPAGTVSGAPKVRAMELIAKLEREERGPYAGAVAAISFNGNLDTCITIRSIFFHQGTAYLQSGAGIVYDSIPEKEYEEVANKAKAMMKAIAIAEGQRE
ncbi:anthranilate synthase component I family protein [Tepidibacillus fermentans]|uniref:Anthranilate synthase component 1 n=1 Tax=Tepidibacillus fermentans TaxID=1281767 RepID=A0A4R3KDW2_9BACI|nr:anthranilate synthase component I family protein [Tepidibacillus fermentans]TCS81285.1 anthranilate synthase component 1 [Tepidibacillus fermentans]